MKNLIKIFQKVSYDTQANACYITINSNKVADTIQKSEDTFVDLDKDNNIIGIEILNVKKHSDIVNNILFTDKKLELCL